MVVRSVASVQDDAVGLQLIQRVDDLCMGSLGVKQGRNSSEKAVAGWLGRTDLGGRLVSLSTKASLLDEGENFSTGSSDGKKGKGYALLVIEGQVLLQAPVRDGPSRGVTTVSS